MEINLPLNVGRTALQVECKTAEQKANPLSLLESSRESRKAGCLALHTLSVKKDEHPQNHELK